MRPSLSAAIIVVSGFAIACRTQDEGPPEIESVSPSQIVSGDAADLVIRGQRFLPRVVANYADSAASIVDDHFEAQLGGAALPHVEFVSTTELHAHLDSALPPGPQSLTIRTPRGDSVTLPNAVQVAARPLSAFSWEAIGSQTMGVAFWVRAVALDDAGVPLAFSGTAVLAPSNGTALSCLTGCDATGSAVFQDGAFQAQVALDVIAGVRLIVTSGAATGTSNPFDVRYPPPASIAFATSARTVAAGACSDEVRLELRDAANQPVPANAPTEVTLSSVPAGALTFFSDAACTAPLSALHIAAANSAVALHFSGQLAGAPEIAVQVADLPRASQAQAVVPGATAAFRWEAIGPQTVDAAFPVRAVAIDAYGNPTPWTGAAALSGSPTAGLHCLSGCDASGRAQLLAGAFDGVVALSLVTSAVRLILTTPEATSASPPFEVVAPAPNLPTALAFASVPHAVTAGQCSPPVLLQLHDALGQIVAAPEAIPVTLTETPFAAIALYANAACTLPLVSPTFAKGASELTFYFSGRTAESVAIDATSSTLDSATQTERIDPAPATSFLWDPLPASVRRGVDLAVTVRARDQFGNAATSFTSTAILAISPAGELLCSIGCSGPLATGAFSAGRWSGWVRVGAPAGSDVLTATSGPATGSSNAFTLVGQLRTPPRAEIVRSKSWARVGEEVTFDASGSSDPESGSDALEVSWNTTGGAAPPGASPWTPWSQGKLFAARFASPGLKSVRLAVRDTEGDLGYATTSLLVVDAATPVCTLTDPGNADDGITTCNNSDLSLNEAIRISNGTATTRELIVVPDGFVATVTSKLTVTSGVDIVGGPGSELRRVEWVFQGGTSTFLGVGLVGEKVFNIGPAASLYFGDTHLSEFDRLYTKGRLTIEDSRFDGCRNDPCLSIDTPAPDVRVLRTTFESPSRDAIHVFDCVSGAREFVGNTFRHLDHAIHVKAGCGAGPVRIAHNTFDAINQAFVVESGVGHVFANNAITGLTMAVINKCGASFSLRGYNIEWNNAVADCTRTDPNTLYADPQYFDALNADYRLQSGSPARDSATDLGFDLAPAMPTLFLGLAPDRGALETW